MRPRKPVPARTAEVRQERPPSVVVPRLRRARARDGDGRAAGRLAVPRRHRRGLAPRGAPAGLLGEGDRHLLRTAGGRLARPQRRVPAALARHVGHAGREGAGPRRHRDVALHARNRRGRPSAPHVRPLLGRRRRAPRRDVSHLPGGLRRAEGAARSDAFIHGVRRRRVFLPDREGDVERVRRHICAESGRDFPPHDDAPHGRRKRTGHLFRGGRERPAPPDRVFRHRPHRRRRALRVRPLHLRRHRPPPLDGLLGRHVRDQRLLVLPPPVEARPPEPHDPPLRPDRHRRPLQRHRGNLDHQPHRRHEPRTTNHEPRFPRHAALLRRARPRDEHRHLRGYHARRGGGAPRRGGAPAASARGRDATCCVRHHCLPRRCLAESLLHSHRRARQGDLDMGKPLRGKRSG